MADNKPQNKDDMNSESGKKIGANADNSGDTDAKRVHHLADDENVPDSAAGSTRSVSSIEEEGGDGNKDARLRINMDKAIGKNNENPNNMNNNSFTTNDGDD